MRTIAKRHVGVVCLTLIAALLCQTAAKTEDNNSWDVLGDDAHLLLQQYQLAQLRQHFEARRAAIAAITTPEQLFERQAYVRETLARINGPFPERTPLNAQTTGRIQRQGYSIENVIYESRPNHHVTANLYIPDGITEPVPAVLIPCGHSANGKAAEAYQRMAISLAQNGIVALCYDPIGQGERHQLLDESGKPIVQGTSEHTLLGVGGFLVGTGTAHYRIWDGIRSIDYLCSRAEVDPDRIGCTGNSGGGTLTSYLMAFDQRIKAAAPSCYLTTLERLFDTIGPQDAEQNFPGQVALGLDHADFIVARAPLPTLMCVARQDFFDIDGAWTTFTEAKRHYSMLGYSERMDIVDFDDKHGFSRPRRVAAMRFLRRWLVGKDDNPNEQEMTLSSDAELQCTKSGEVLTDFPSGVNVVALHRARAETLANQRAALWNESTEKTLSEVRRLAGIRPVDDVRKAVSHGSVDLQNNSGSIRKLTLQREGEIPIPALLRMPATPSDNGKLPGVVFVSSNGKASHLADESDIKELLSEGKAVLSIDVRGFGETIADKNGKRSGYFGSDFKTSLLAIHLNRPLLGQRTEDVLCAVNYLASLSEIDPQQIEVVGEGLCGPVALHAAACDKRIQQVTLVRSIESWTDVVATPLAQDQLTNVVPFALEAYDLPDLVRAMAPRNVVIRDSIKATKAAK